MKNTHLKMPLAGHAISQKEELEATERLFEFINGKISRMILFSALEKLYHSSPSTKQEFARIMISNPPETKPKFPREFKLKDEVRFYPSRGFSPGEEKFIDGAPKKIQLRGRVVEIRDVGSPQTGDLLRIRCYDGSLWEAWACNAEADLTPDAGR